MDISEVRAQVARNELLRLIKDIGLPLCLFGTVTEVSAPNASVRLDGDTESTVCSDMVGCSVDDRCIVANIKNMAVVIAAIGGTDTSDKADVDHEHAASDITSGSLSVARGGTGRTSLTSGQYLVGSGTSAVQLKTKAQVLDDIGAAASSHNHTAGDINSGTLGVARGGTGKGTFTAGSYLIGNGTSALESKTPAQVLSDIGAAASNHTHTPADIGAAPATHSHAEYVEKTGDTMTGPLVVESYIRGKANGIDSAASSVSVAQYHVIGIVDMSDRYVTYLQTAQLTDGAIQTTLSSRRLVSNANVDNSLRLRIESDGTRSVSVSDAAIWRDALGLSPVQLFSGSASGTVTLSSSVASYARIKVFFSDARGNMSGNREFFGLAAGSTFVLEQAEPSAASETTLRNALYEVGTNGNTLTVTRAGYVRFNHANKTISEASTTSTNYLRITRVEGYSF